MFPQIKIPKIWLSYDKILIESYISDFSNEDYLKFKNSEEVKKFNLLLEKISPNLLKNISKLSGIRWCRKEIPIYLVPDIPKKSFAHPLVLILKGGLERRFLVLAHELVHVNFIADGDRFFIGENKEKRMDLPNIEAICWLISKLALQKTVGDDWFKYEEEWKEILNWDKSENTKKEIEELERSWDFNKMNFKKFLKTRKP